MAAGRNPVAPWSKQVQSLFSAPLLVRQRLLDLSLCDSSLSNGFRLEGRLHGPAVDFHPGVGFRFEGWFDDGVLCHWEFS